MHEMSVACELSELIRRHLPRGAELVAARVRIGPMHGVNPDALQWAWEVVRLEACWPAAQLIIELPPWQLKCPKCGRTWQPAAIDERCTCGELHAQIVGGDEFMLAAIEIADDKPAADGSAPNSAAASSATHGLNSGGAK